MSKKILKSVDGFVLFTEQMNDYFGEYKKPYTVIEGVYRDKYELEQLDRKNYFMCAGSLHKNTGIEEMINAFEALGDDTIELWFFGSGAMDEYIISKSEENHKIKHKGFVDPSILFKYEQQALLLINVRNPEEGYTKYSFPSKTYEYLASGTLLLSTDLPGIPKEYKKHMIMIEDNSVEKIKEGMTYALSLSKEDIERRGAEAQLFIKKEKNKYIQSQKLIELLEKL